MDLLANSYSLDSQEYLEKIINQNNSIVSTLSEKSALRKTFDNELNEIILNIDNYLTEIKLSQPQQIPKKPIEQSLEITSKFKNENDPFINEIGNKIRELEQFIKNNKATIEKEESIIPGLDKSKKDHIEKIRDFSCQKRVYMDLVEEKSMVNLTYLKNFRSDINYEYKILLLIFEGAFLEKVLEKIHQKLSLIGKSYGWAIMNEEEEEEKRLDREYTFQQRIAGLPFDAKASEERQFKLNEEGKKMESDNLREIVSLEWQNYFRMFWENAENSVGNANFDETRYQLYVKTTKDVIMELFKKICFNAWQFKNIFLACEEFILMEHLKKYLIKFLPENVPESKQEEEALGVLLKNIEVLLEEMELLTIEPAKRQEVKEKAKNAYITATVNEMNKIRKDSNQREIKKIEVPYLMNVFLPLLMNLRTLVCMGIGNKRVAYYGEEISKVNRKKIIIFSHRKKS
jgi:hypothetical protein